ncbi:MAG TPA: hypothetical protein VFO60_06695, partial [Candidatus Dormibacteraeota bacterium]|nr:hypothetical protein [Candidatus Dormibacteraeota bacterium]
MTRIIDTIPAFEDFAGQAGLEGPLRRDQMWREVYEAAHPEVFAAFHAIPGMSPRPARMVKELSAIRRLASDSAPIVREVIEQIDPVVR